MSPIVFVVPTDHLWVLCPDVIMVIASEVAVDIIKHAFITKFNDISADVSAFTAVCSKQITGIVFGLRKRALNDSVGFRP